MSLISHQVCMDTPDWLQGAVNEERGMDSSPPSGDMITCSRPMLERRLRPHHDQALKCPRCDSAHTKFCYYNNYSLSQPRYFCKACRRYWTKGGSLRNIPVGGGCRKNKSVATKKTTHQQKPSFSSHNGNNLYRSFPEIQLPYLTTLLGTHENLGNTLHLMGNTNFNALMENPRNHGHFMGNTGLEDTSNGFKTSNFHGICSPFGFSFDGNNGTFMENCKKLMLPFEGISEDPNTMETMPNNKVLAIEWHDQSFSEVGKDSFDHLNFTGLWNNYGSSATNPLV